MAKIKTENTLDQNEPKVEEKEEQLLDEEKSFIQKAKEAAFKTRLVTITSNDKRDSDVETTVIVTCENQYFGLSRIVPLNIQIQLEQCLIDTLKEIKIPLHVPEMVNGRQTGNSILSQTNKYNISYGE